MRSAGTSESKKKTVRSWIRGNEQAEMGSRIAGGTSSDGDLHFRYQRQTVTQQAKSILRLRRQHRSRSQSLKKNWRIFLKMQKESVR